jgi:hypothetical protein
MNGLDRAVYVHTNSSVTPLIKQPIGRGAIYGNYASLAAQVTL